MTVVYLKVRQEMNSHSLGLANPTKRCESLAEGVANESLATVS